MITDICWFFQSPLDADIPACYDADRTYRCLEEETGKMADILLNLLIFTVTAFLLLRTARKDGEWMPDRVRMAFRFFTVQSNALCAAAALAAAAASLAGEMPEWIRIIKYIGTSAVTVTMLTVFLFLAPSAGKDWVQVLLKGPDLFMHLLTPLAALISFGVFEKKGMTFGQSLWGMLPVVLYGPLYLYKIRFAPKEKGWDDFYGFNRTGRWPVSFAAMLAGTFLICLGLMAWQNA